MKADLLVRGGNVVFPGADIREVDVAILDGKVVALAQPGAVIDATRTLDVPNKLVLPGIIDAHAHLTIGPGADGYETETRSGTVGGVTTSLSYMLDSGDMAEAVEREIAKAKGRACADFGLHPSLVTDQQMDAFPAITSRLGIPSFKFFMTFRGDEGAYLGIPGNDDGFLFRLLRMVAKTKGALACIHAENVEIIWALREEAERDGDGTIHDWDRNRPDYAEGEATRRVLYLAEVLDAPVYVVHITCAEALEAVREAKARRPGKVFGETCTHYLTLTCDTAPSPEGKVNPPLRHAGDIDALWEGVADGTIDVVGSDHVPRRRESKEGGIWKASSGFPGIATFAPVFLSVGVRRGLSVPMLVAKITSAPATIFGLAPRKGSLLPGADGDLTIVDPLNETEIDASLLASYSDYTPYQGWRVAFMPSHTVVRGEVVVEDGRFVGQAGIGSYISRRPCELSG